MLENLELGLWPRTPVITEPRNWLANWFLLEEVYLKKERMIPTHRFKNRIKR
jgi:hypothetical protein